MTRSCFIESVTEWYELLEVCGEYGCDVCEDIIDEGQLDLYVCDDIRDAMETREWGYIRDMLNDISRGYDYYRINGSFDYDGMDYDDFDVYKERVLDWIDEYGSWEDEDDDGDDEEDTEADSDSDVFSQESESEPEEPAVEEEDFTVIELMNMCGAELVSVRRALEQRQAEEYADMNMLFVV